MGEDLLNKKLCELDPEEILDICIDHGMFVYDNQTEKFTLSYKVLKAIVLLYQNVQRKFPGAQKAFVTSIKLAVDFLVGNDKTPAGEYRSTLGLIGLLTLLEADARKDGNAEAAKAFDEIRRHGLSARFNVKAALTHLKRQMKVREEDRIYQIAEIESELWRKLR